MHLLSSAVVSVVFAAFCVAADPARPANALPAVARFIDEQTIVVGRLEASRLDLDALGAIVVDLTRALYQNNQGHSPLEEVMELKATAKSWLEAFKEADGTDVYMLYSIADLPDEEDPFLVAPLSPTANARAIAGLLCSGQPDGPTSLPADGGPTNGRSRVAERLGDAVVAGPRNTVERLRTLKPAARPEIRRALQAAGDAPVRVVLVPTADSRRVIEEMLPNLPAAVGGGPVTAVTRGALWAAMSLHTTPAVAVHIVVQSQDAQAARALVGVIEKAFQSAAENRQLGGEIAGFEQLLVLLKPVVRNDRLIVELKGEVVREVVDKVIGPPLGRARTLALRTASAKALLDIGKAIFTYSAKHNDRWPPDLPALVKEGYLKEHNLANPSDPLRKNGYVYIRPSKNVTQVNPQQMLMHEAFDQWGDGINVAYADGHVEFIEDQKEFEKLLKTAAAQGTVIKPPTTRPGAAAGRKGPINDLRQIALACMLYTTDHQGQWPKDLRTLVDARLLPQEVLINPKDPSDQMRYAYIRPTEASPKKPPKLMIAYEAQPDWKEGVAVAFADGHVEVIRTKARFDELLAQARGEKPPGN